MDELDGGIRRVTLPLPNRPGHVHAYLLPGEGGWTIVDTGLGLPDARDRWAADPAAPRASGPPPRAPAGLPSSLRWTARRSAGSSSRTSTPTTSARPPTWRS